MGVNVFPAPASGMTTTRFPIALNQPFIIPAGLTLRNTVTTTTTFAAGELPAQVWAVIVGGGGGGSKGSDGGTYFYGGGGGGGVACGWIDVPSSGAVAAIGAGGLGASGSMNGSAGGISSFAGFAVGGGGGGSSVTTLPDSQYDNNGVIPSGDGGGYGGLAYNSSAPTFSAGYTSKLVYKNSYPFNNAAFLTAMGWTSGSGAASQFPKTPRMFNPYGGSCGGFYTISNAPHGLVGGGGTVYYAGGSSYRDGLGNVPTFSGGNASTGGGGGAGLLANGSAASGNNGGAGGSGGGGGGATLQYNNGAAGGAGCVLIYY